ncbi:MAG: type II toxin-antitoxin system VapC family toxin [Candidatus Aenigmarchaeota archaeon]|nr:type II toxin-antitoxin system VapC family toxin [Candidatus Aenigmarchaeota archaeon]
MILIDTNIFVDHLRNYPLAVEFFNSLTYAIYSAVTEAELLAGKANDDEEKREKLMHFLHRWEKIHVTNPVAVLAGDLARKHNIEIPDAIIAATALLNEATLVTRNIKDFERVENLKLEMPY